MQLSTVLLSFVACLKQTTFEQSLHADKQFSIQNKISFKTLLKIVNVTPGCILMTQSTIYVGQCAGYFDIIHLTHVFVSF